MCTSPLMLVVLVFVSYGRSVSIVPRDLHGLDYHWQKVGSKPMSQLLEEFQPTRTELAALDPLKVLAMCLLASHPGFGWQVAGQISRLAMNNGFDKQHPANLARHRRHLAASSIRENHRYVPFLSRSTSCVACIDLPSDAEDACDVTIIDNRDALESKLMQLAATTNRGASRSTDDDERLGELIRQLECLGPPDVSSGALDGSWRLAYATCPAYRSSPFFWAYGQVAEGLKEPIFSITDGLPFYRVGVARQILTDTAAAGTLVSAVELTVFVFDALLPPLKGLVTTTSSARPDDADPSSLILEVQTTEVKESVLPFTENVVFPSAEVLEGLKGGSNKVRLSTSYLSTTMRISRSPDGDIFVYVRE